MAALGDLSSTSFKGWPELVHTSIFTKRWKDLKGSSGFTLGTAPNIRVGIDCTNDPLRPVFSGFINPLGT
jgi:hypothetical protein